MFEFINTVLLLILVNAKVPEMKVPKKFPILSGKYTDFNIPWYRNVGSTIMLTMIINIVSPYFVELLFHFRNLFNRWRDRGYTLDYKIT